MKKAKLTTTLDPALIWGLKVLSARAGMPIGDLVSEPLQSFLNSQYPQWQSDYIINDSRESKK